MKAPWRLAALVLAGCVPLLADGPRFPGTFDGSLVAEAWPCDGGAPDGGSPGSPTDLTVTLAQEGSVVTETGSAWPCHGATFVLTGDSSVNASARGKQCSDGSTLVGGTLAITGSDLTMTATIQQSDDTCLTETGAFKRQ